MNGVVSILAGDGNTTFGGNVFVNVMGKVTMPPVVNMSLGKLAAAICAGIGTRGVMVIDSIRARILYLRNGTGQDPAAVTVQGVVDAAMGATEINSLVVRPDAIGGRSQRWDFLEGETSILRPVSGTPPEDGTSVDWLLDAMFGPARPMLTFAALVDMIDDGFLLNGNARGFVLVLHHIANFAQLTIAPAFEWENYPDFSDAAIYSGAVEMFRFQLTRQSVI